MGTEIERKFMVHPDAWHPDPARGIPYRQGYLSTDPARVVRVRTMGDSAALTIKGRTQGIARLEFEYAIPLADAAILLEQCCARPLVEKRRYRERHGGRIWAIDVFAGVNAGLVLAEVELPSSSTPIVLPPWVGPEVSDDPRYFNSNLARFPFNQWSPER